MFTDTVSALIILSHRNEQAIYITNTHRKKQWKNDKCDANHTKLQK